MGRAIHDRWDCASPWAWKQKHVRWFLDHHLRSSATGTVYYYQLTTRLIRMRLGIGAIIL
ncbi:hypothetical protein PSYAR_20036 [Pseudomonas syringae pv. aceris str. M302273]|nr:hypothetical protein PSYAR_20036 [Pseudomonas syringae pv. aceris str. M302273]